MAVSVCHPAVNSRLLEPRLFPAPGLYFLRTAPSIHRTGYNARVDRRVVVHPPICLFGSVLARSEWHLRHKRTRQWDQYKAGPH